MSARAAFDPYRLLVLLVLPFVLSWPAWFNGQPFFFADTTAYLKGAASAAELVVKTDTSQRWLHIDARPAAPDAGAAAAGAAAPAHLSSAPGKGGVIAGRSIYYGAFLFGVACLLGLQGVALLQALLATLLIASVLRARFALGYRAIALLLLALAAASPLPYFASMLMPDIFAGLGIAGAIALTALPAAPRAARALWALLVLAAVLFHSANILILLATIATLVTLALLLRRAAALPWRAVGLVCALVATGVAGEAAFSYGVRQATGEAPIRPPFITARLLADGPGNDYVKHHCPGAGFEVCNYARDFTRASSDDFLWSTVPAVGVFTLADSAARARLGQQDAAFAKAVLARYPLAVLANSAKNIGAQIGYVGLEEYIYPPDLVREFSQKIPARELATLARTRAARQRFDVSYSEAVIRATSAAALLACLAAAVATFRRRRYGEFTLLAIFMLALLINAGVCGALSTPHDRYQARLVWILQLMGMLVVAARMKWIALAAPPAVAAYVRRAAHG